MREKISYFLFLTITLLCLADAGSAQKAAKYKDLPNFHKVNDNLYRGGQPKKDGIIELARLGIKTIINLRSKSEQTKAEEIEARKSGFEYFNVPMGNLGSPSDKTVRRVMAIINAPENQPVFVHCKRGSDRTGTIIAVYRIEHDNWTGKQAMEEANQYGLLFWQVGMKSFIQSIYEFRNSLRNNVLMPDFANY